LDIEFHYYTNYIVALAAGFSNDAAYKIAYSAQLLDNNTTEHTVILSNGEFYTNQISQTFNITLPQKTLYHLYQCFHFLPGDNLHFPHLTTPNSKRAQKMLAGALKSKNPYNIGIASHAYSDTWAHQNFSGRFDKSNAASGFPEILIPNIGHADFGEQPDIVGLIWHDSRHNLQINNSLRFIEAAQHLYYHYCNSFNSPSLDWNALEKMLIYCFGIPSTSLFEITRDMQYRINKYKEVCLEEFNIKIIDYILDDWLNENQLQHWVEFQEGVKYFLKTIN
jgi:hypothetical protein